jgi:hypothetical protein
MMKLKLAAALVASTAAITMLAGCPAVNTPDTGTPFTWDPNALFTGELTYAGEPVAFDSSYTHKIKIREAGESTLPPTVDLIQNRYFQFISGVTADKAYQAISDYSGPAATDKTSLNMIRLMVSSPATASTSATRPQVKMDLKWDINPSTGFDTKVTSYPVTFTHNALTLTGKEFQYQIQVVDSANSTVWGSAWSTSVSRSWNGKRGTETDTPTGAEVADGTYGYRIKFREMNGTYGGANIYGESQLIPLTIQRP